MNHQDEAIKAVVGYMDACDTAWHPAIVLRTLIETAAAEYAKSTSPRQTYETLASIALEVFNADQAKRKGEQP